MRLRGGVLPLQRCGGRKCGRVRDPLRPLFSQGRKKCEKPQMVLHLLGGRESFLRREPVPESRLSAHQLLRRLRHHHLRASHHGLPDAAAPPDGVYRDHPRGRLGNAPRRYPLAAWRADHRARHGRHRHGVCPPCAGLPSRVHHRRAPHGQALRPRLYRHSRHRGAGQRPARNGYPCHGAALHGGDRGHPLARAHRAAARQRLRRERRPRHRHRPGGALRRAQRRAARRCGARRGRA